MQPENKTKLENLLAELYESGETTETIIDGVLSGLLDSEKVDMADHILSQAPIDRINDYIEKLAAEMISEGGFPAKRLLYEFSDADIIDLVKSDSSLFCDIMETGKFDEEIEEYIANERSTTGVYIPANKLTLDKRCNLRSFLETLFPMYADQNQLGIQFI